MSATRSLLACLIGLLTFTVSAQPQRRIEVRINGVANDTIFLANYYGNKLFYADTAVANARGEVVFARSKGYKSGVYAVVIPGPKYFELLVNEDDIRLETDAADLMGRMKVVRSEENQRFFAYIAFLNEQRKGTDDLRKQLESLPEGPQRQAIQSQLEEKDRAVSKYQRDLVQEAPAGSLVALIVRMSIPIDLEKPRKADGSVDSLAAYYQFRQHFWDHTDLTDPRIVNTPVFQNKFDEYIGKVVPQVPDTINRLVDELIDRLGPDPELFKFAVHQVTYKYETSDIMGMDAVFVHMARTYYCPKGSEPSRAFWMGDEKLDKLCERARKLAPLTVGTKSFDIILTDTTEHQWLSAHRLPNEFVLVCFWDPHCGHCKKELPEIYKVYQERFKALDIEVFAVAKATDERLFKDWKAYVKEKVPGWINVGLTPSVYEGAKKNPYAYIPRLTTLQSLNYSDTWDVYSTPKFFLLDGDRKIVGKQLSADQVADLVTRLREARVRTGSRP